MEKYGAQLSPLLAYRYAHFVLSARETAGYQNYGLIKTNLVAQNKTINWMPASTGTGRFGNWLKTPGGFGTSAAPGSGATPLPSWRNKQATRKPNAPPRPSGVRTTGRKSSASIDEGFIDQGLPLRTWKCGPCTGPMWDGNHFLVARVKWGQNCFRECRI